MDLLLYFIFLFSFISSAGLCIYQDFYKEYPRIQGEISRGNIIKIYKKCLPLVLFNIFVCIPLILCFPFNMFLSPFNYWQVYHFPLLLFLVDFTFYFFHYLFHHPRLYVFHKVHHQIRRPVCISALYLHPVDLIFGNILPLFLPVFIVGSSYEVLCVWTFFTVFETTYGAHSGIKGRGDNHDMHHKIFVKNYGSGLYICDRLLKTYLSLKM